MLANVFGEATLLDGSTISLIVTTLGGVLVAYMQLRSSADRADLRSKILVLEFQHRDSLEKLRLAQTRELECDRRLRALEDEVLALRAAHKAARPSGFYLWADFRDEIVLDASDGTHNVTGWRPTELVGKRLSVLLPADVALKHGAAVDKLRAGGGLAIGTGYAIRSRLLTKAGVEIHVTVAIDPAPERGAGVFRAEVIMSGVVGM